MSASTSAPTRLVLCPSVVMPRSSWLEFQRDAIDAVAQMRRRGSVIKHVAEVAPTTTAVDLVAHHTIATVRLAFDRAGQRIVEARPASSALKFHFGNEQRLIASCT